MPAERRDEPPAKRVKRVEPQTVTAPPPAIIVEPEREPVEEDPLEIFEQITLRSDAVIALNELFPPASRDEKTTLAIAKLLDSPTLSKTISPIIAVNVLRNKSRGGMLANLIPVVDGIVTVLGPLLGEAKHATITRAWDESKVHLKSTTDYTQRFFNQVKLMNAAEIDNVIASSGGNSEGRQVMSLALILLRIGISSIKEDSIEQDDF